MPRVRAYAQAKRDNPLPPGYACGSGIHRNDCPGSSCLQARAQIQVAGNQPAKASVALLRSADTAFNWGIASIVLGWTIIVPFIGFFQYIDVSKAAKKENTLVPGKATIGLALSLLFGVTQVAAVIAKRKLLLRAKKPY